jgi:RNA 2',3'-cyclic 3'-phosphodiesterase
MRLFIAIGFPPEIVSHLESIQTELKGHAKSGNFVESSNLHLTVLFLGEMEATRLNMVKDAMRRITVPSFSILLQDISSFKTQEGRLYYLNVKKNDQLETIVHELKESLNKSGFGLEDKEYKPHITLGREVILEEDYDLVSYSQSIVHRRVDVEKVSLMRSDRVDHQVVYKEVASRHLP